MKKRIDGVVLMVRDVSRAKAFYCDILGFKIKYEAEGFVDLETETVPLGLMEIGVAANLFGSSHISPNQAEQCRLELSANVGNVDEVYQNLKARGVEFIQPPTDRPWGQRTADFKDPDGNLWEVYHWTKDPH